MPLLRVNSIVLQCQCTSCQVPPLTVCLPLYLLAFVAKQLCYAVAVRRLSCRQIKRNPCL